jgi:hypothetical protein
VLVCVCALLRLLQLRANVFAHVPLFCWWARLAGLAPGVSGARVCVRVRARRGLMSHSGDAGWVPWGRRLLYDNTYNIILVILLMNIFLGLTIGTFAVLRKEEADTELDMQNRCFICDLDRCARVRACVCGGTARSCCCCCCCVCVRVRVCVCVSVFVMGAPRHACPGRARRPTMDRFTADGFDVHIRRDHNMWNYLYLVAHVRMKPSTELTGMEGFLLTKVRACVPHASCRVRLCGIASCVFACVCVCACVYCVCMRMFVRAFALFVHLFTCKGCVW